MDGGKVAMEGGAATLLADERASSISGITDRAAARLRQLKTVHQRIAVIDVNRIVPDDARPARYARHDRSMVANLRRGFDPAVEQRPDDAFVDEFRADRQPAFCRELSHSCRRSGSAG